jgi:nicotinamidase/pyrazinamidase
MVRALLVIDVQNDFTEGGALGVAGGARVAEGVAELIAHRRDSYDLVIASRDWHEAESDNGGHFSLVPDFVDSWPVHCVRGTEGAEYHPALDASTIDVHLTKGTGSPSYSAFEGVTGDGGSAIDVLRGRQVDAVDVVGLATDHCVRASVLDALEAGLAVRVVTDLVAGVAPVSSEAALAEMTEAGATLVDRAGLDAGSAGSDGTDGTGSIASGVDQGADS